MRRETGGESSRKGYAMQLRIGIVIQREHADHLLTGRRRCHPRRLRHGGQLRTELVFRVAV